MLLEACSVRRSCRRVVEDDLAALTGRGQALALHREATRIPPRCHRGANYTGKKTQGSIVHVRFSIRLWWNAMGMPANSRPQTQPFGVAVLMGIPINSISRSAFRDVARPSRSL